MQVTETKSEGLSREYKISLPAKEIEEKISHRLKQIAQTAQLPGFRRGKVPVSLLRKRYGPRVMGEILEKAVGDSSRQAMEEKGVRPATQPEIEITSFEDGKDLEYTIALEMLPEIKPVDFSKIKLERLVPETDEEAVQAALDNIAAGNKTSQTVTSKRKSKKGDIAVIDFVGAVDGEEFPGGKAEGYHLELGSDSFIPGFEDQLTGAKAGEQVEVTVTFPEQYGAADLAGKEAVFQVDVQELRETTPAPVDDELAKKLGVESLDKLKETIAEEQAREFKNMARLRMKRKLLDELSETCDFELPQKMAESEFDAIWQQFEEQKKSATEPDEDADKLTEDEQKAEFQTIAERRVRLGLLLSEIGRENNIEINQEDVTQAMLEEARRHPGQEQAVMDFYKDNPEAMQQLTAPIYEEKVVDFIIEMASVTDRSATMDGLIDILKEDDEAEEKAKEKKTKAKPKAAAAKKAAGSAPKKRKAPAKKTEEAEESEG